MFHKILSSKKNHMNLIKLYLQSSLKYIFLATSFLANLSFLFIPKICTIFIILQKLQKNPLKSIKIHPRKFSIHVPLNSEFYRTLPKAQKKLKSRITMKGKHFIHIKKSYIIHFLQSFFEFLLQSTIILKFN